ncbi:MAG: hypothetical protein SWX82_00885 [Cyanobacteriota bacterium]|nr:hypothetical protein [Cyanobacteriota bacterium]
MDIVKQTEKELVLKDKLWLLLFIVFPCIAGPLFISLITLSEMGLSEMGAVIKASCQRVEPTQVNCQINSSKYFGLIKDSSTSLTRVTETKLNSRKKKDSDGDTYFDYFVTLVSQTGKEVVSLQNNSYPQEIMEMVVKINTFINYSTEPSLLIHYDLRWKWRNLVFLAFHIAFIGMGIFIAYPAFYLQTLILTKRERQLTYKVFSLLGIKTKRYSFAQIQEFILESDTDFDGDKLYRLKVVLPPENHQREINLISDSDIEKVKKLANGVADFIEIPYKEVSNE